MRWFKHMTDMSADVKIKRLVRKYGVEGYGLYNYILELIVRKLETEAPLPDLEESSEDIAGDMKMDTLRVEEIMLFCINQGLFEQDEMTGRIVAAKVYKFLAQSETRSKEIRTMIGAYKNQESPKIPASQLSVTVRDKCEEQNRTEQNRTEGSRHARHPRFDVPMNQTRYENLCAEYTPRIADWAIRARIDWESAKGKPAAKDYAAAAAQWIERAKKFGDLPSMDDDDGLRPHRAGDPL